MLAITRQNCEAVNGCRAVQQRSALELKHSSQLSLLATVSLARRWSAVGPT